MASNETQIFAEALARFLKSERVLFGKALDCEDIIFIHAGEWVAQNVPAFLQERVWNQAFGKGNAA